VCGSSSGNIIDIEFVKAMIWACFIRVFLGSVFCGCSMLIIREVDKNINHHRGSIRYASSSIRSASSITYQYILIHALNQEIEQPTTVFRANLSCLPCSKEYLQDFCNTGSLRHHRCNDKFLQSSTWPNTME